MYCVMCVSVASRNKTCRRPPGLPEKSLPRQICCIQPFQELYHTHVDNIVTNQMP